MGTGDTAIMPITLGTCVNVKKKIQTFVNFGERLGIGLAL